MKQVSDRYLLPALVLILLSAGHRLAAQTTANVGEPRIVVRLPVARPGHGGNLVMQPNVAVEGATPDLSLQNFRYHEPFVSPANEEYYPSIDGGYCEEKATDGCAFGCPGSGLFTHRAEATEEWDDSEKTMVRRCKPCVDYIWDEVCGRDDCHECSPIKRMFGFNVHRDSFDKGIGLKRVPLALMEMDITQPLNNYRARFIMNYDTVTPDRAEFLWKGSTFGGPQGESSLDWQEIRVHAETGAERFSVFTEYPIRILDPVINDNTAGFGDMSIGNKLVLINGDDWQVTQVFRTWFQTGASSKGLGTGYVRMEPGLLGRFRWTDRTYLHYELKYNFAIAGSPGFSGQVLRYGFGITHLLHETDTFAYMPTLEFVGWNVMDGLKTLPGGAVVPVDGESFLSILPGARFVLGPAGDLGLFEFGVATGFNTSNNGFYDTQLQFDLRFSY